MASSVSACTWFRRLVSNAQARDGANAASVEPVASTPVSTAAPLRNRRRDSPPWGLIFCSVIGASMYPPSASHDGLSVTKPAERPVLFLCCGHYVLCPNPQVTTMYYMHRGKPEYCHARRPSRLLFQ